MLDLGMVRPGSTIRIPFSTFDKDDGSSITMTNYAAADILVYKDGSTTERASTAGFTATTDFDAKTGKHLAVIDLADNTTAGFFASGSEYIVAIDAVTVDAVTTGGWIARFSVGYPEAVHNTTIATLSSQTSFTLTDGPAEDDALNGMWAIIHDVASRVQWSRVVILDYTGSTKTVTLAAGATFTAAATDNFSVIDMAPLQATTTGRTLDVSTGGEAGVDWANIGSPTTTVNLSGTSTKALEPTTAGRTLDVTATGEAGIDWANIGSPTTAVNLSATNIDVDQVVASVSGAVGSVTGAVGSVTGAVGSVTATVNANMTQVSGDSVAADNLEAMLDGTGGVTLTTAITGNITGNLSGSVGSVTGAVGSVTGNVGGNVVGTVGTVNALAANVITAAATAADFTTEIQTGLATSTALATAQTTLTKLDGMLQGDSGSGNLYQFTVPALAQAPTGGSAPSAATIADAVWDEVLSGHLTAGTAGEALASAETAADRFGTMIQGDSGSANNYQYTVTALAQAPSGGLDAAGVRAAVGLASANLDTQLSGIQSDTNDIQTRVPAALVGGRMDASVGAMAANTLTASALAADAVTEIQSGLSTLDAAGVRTAVGLASANLDTQLDALPTAAENTTAVWAAAARTLTALDEDNTTLDIDAAVRAAVGLASANLDTQLDALPTAAEINAEVVDALATDTYAEPGQGAPAATASLAAKIGYLYKAWRNKTTQTSSTYSLYADDTTTVDQKATVSDDGTTLTKGEVATGP